MKTLILIPTYNAQSKLLDVLTDIEVNAPGVDVLVIDHGSSDRTHHILKNNNINRLIMPLETSYYHALSLGMYYAFKNKYDIVVEWDDKGKFPTSAIKHLVATIKRTKCDLVLGSRYVNNKPPKGIRWTGTRALRKTIKVTTRQKITDPTLRLRAYGKKAIKIFAKYENIGPAPDSIALLLKNDFTFRESYAILEEGFKKQLHSGYAHSTLEMMRWWAWITFVLPFKRKMKKGN